ncbi:MAG: hypothetical protein KDB61_07020 [Planctomycetes bacterium]|nr:hypothetical protein [Planctomycetota bacterium]
MTVHRLKWLLVAILLLTTHSACITTAVWGGSIEDRDRDGVSTLHTSGGHALSDNVWVKIIATPFAIVLDICTYPIQAVLFGWDDEDEDDCD